MTDCYVLVAVTVISCPCCAPRHYHFPHVKLSGWTSQDRPVCFMSASAHYSIVKGANTLGMGQNAVRTVSVDNQGRMDVEAFRQALAECRKEGMTPFYVCATQGTTTLGSFDPIAAIADVLDEDYHSHHSASSRRVHLHVDASWGGGVLFHSSLRPLLMGGVERSDSCTVNPHKLLGVPLQCSILLVKDPLILAKATSTVASYLFHSHPDSALGPGGSNPSMRAS